MRLGLSVPIDLEAFGTCHRDTRDVREKLVSLEISCGPSDEESLSKSAALFVAGARLASHLAIQANLSCMNSASMLRHSARTMSICASQLRC